MNDRPANEVRHVNAKRFILAPIAEMRRAMASLE